ncbi:hypothetical protein K7X08_000508 [Anisodus acutangulus]|uniref:AAA+ ATPase domain-containing protein n=1 Tax=Anisodus acutangulus TaxID=402998 RepID=A0A9Q1RB06_9SOLA|nr:hypothetical protein K7X08_000508 [Anisodus acutangulus]
MGTKVNRDVRRGGSRVHKRQWMTRGDDSDDSLLVDELDQGPPTPWGRGGSRSRPPWLLGGLDMQGTTSWGLNVASSGWGHQSEASANLTSGIQTAGPSFKGGADIQPLQVDETISFDDIGGLSEHIDALKEMVFFPLLYPDFFASYNITSPRGVLLCGPPGTGKTLITRALACAESKAGQKVSFYMRKGADVLRKWVGEAERQLKLLFEEAQRNHPSIIFFDEIDGLAPVRRPGRFDCEFNFPLPGLEARAEILDIHTRKWKQPPSKVLKMELAASCVGYCGADLKALCTEAAICAFREKYPQVYTSDDKFLIDVLSVTVKKYHFLKVMTTITPAAHRGSIVHSRPLSSAVAPCLYGPLRKAMSIISDIFPLSVSSELSKLYMLSYGSAIPLVYRPRLLLCGSEGVGLAHDQLKAVLRTLLEELPSDLPILLFGTSSVPLSDLPMSLLQYFHTIASVHSCLLILLSRCLSWLTFHVSLCLDTPSDEDRSLFFDRLIEASLSIQVEATTKKSGKLDSLPELPKAPKVSAGPKASELKAKAEAEGHALSRLRMCLHDGSVR